MSPDPIRRTIKLGAAAHELRRHVGPTTWVVLEEMLQRSTGDGDDVVAQVSIRALASSLGLAKGTVNRAVGRLRDLGVIDASQARARSSPLVRCCSVCSSLLLCCSSVSVRPPLVRPALPPSRGLRPFRVRLSLRSFFNFQTGARA